MGSAPDAPNDRARTTRTAPTRRRIRESTLPLCSRAAHSSAGGGHNKGRGVELLWRIDAGAGPVHHARRRQTPVVPTVGERRSIGARTVESQAGARVLQHVTAAHGIAIFTR